MGHVSLIRVQFAFNNMAQSVNISGYLITSTLSPLVNLGNFNVNRVGRIPITSHRRIHITNIISIYGSWKTIAHVSQVND